MQFHRETGRVSWSRPRLFGVRDHESQRFSNDLTSREKAVTILHKFRGSTYNTQITARNKPLKVWTRRPLVLRWSFDSLEIWLLSKSANVVRWVFNGLRWSERFPRTHRRVRVWVPADSSRNRSEEIITLPCGWGVGPQHCLYNT